MPHDVEKHSHSLLPSDPELKVKALETALIKRGLIDPAALDEIIDTYQNKIGPKNGATIIAKALLDKDFKKALISDPMQILEKHGFLGRQGEHIKVVENTPEVHNIVVCTLCSCYPWPLLGIPPTWYNLMNIGLVSSESPESACPTLVLLYPKILKLGFGTPLLK